MVDDSYYPLAGHSRHRRRMALIAQQQAEAAAAAAAATADPAPITIPLRPIHRDVPGRWELKRMVEGVQPMTWVFTGDDVVHGARHTRGRRNFVELFQERVRWKLRRLLDVVVNTGMDGSRLKNLGKSLDWRVQRFRPAVCCLMAGLADSLAGEEGVEAFATTLERVVTGLRDDGGVVVLNTPPLIDARRAAKRRRLPDYVQAVREVAEGQEVLLVDHWAHWQSVEDVSPLLAKDGVHPNAHGHREIARLLFAELDLLDERRPSGKPGKRG